MFHSCQRCCGTWLSRLACLFIYYFSSLNNEVYSVCVCFRVVAGAVEHGYQDWLVYLFVYFLSSPKTVVYFVSLCFRGSVNIVIKIGLSIYLLFFLP